MARLNLNGRTVLVTGSTGKLGRMISIVLAKAGANVVLQYKTNAEKAKQLQQEITTIGTKSMIIKADLTKQCEIQKMKQEIGEVFPCVDVVVSNAYVPFSNWSPIVSCNTEEYITQFYGTVMQNIYLIKEFIPDKMRQNYGRYIGINTIYSIHCGATGSAYSVPKKALDGLLRTLAKEVGKYQITVNQVFPGWIETADHQAMTDSGNFVDEIPLGHHGAAIDVTNAVAFLASDLAEFITGSILPVCGGEVMPGV